jgi:GrpB-like predicted nucleotidyltransferase (UPF0157 family)
LNNLDVLKADVKSSEMGRKPRSKESKPANHSPLTDEEIRAHTVGELQPFSEKVLIVDYDPTWPDLFRREAERVRNLLGPRALQIEHTGSTSVPGLAAKPIIDMLLVVRDQRKRMHTYLN